MRDMLTCAWREITRRKGRTLANVIGYMLAVGGSIILATVLFFARDASSAVLTSTGTHFIAFSPSCEIPCYLPDGTPSGEAFMGTGGVLTSPIQPGTLDKIRAISEVKHAAPFILFRVNNKDTGIPFLIGGFELDDAEAVGTTSCAETDIVQGRFLREDDERAVMLEESFQFAHSFIVGQQIDIGGLPFTIVGIVRPGVRPAKADVYMSLEDAAQVVSRRIGYAQEELANIILVEVKSAKLQEEAMRKVKMLLPVVSSYACYKPAATVMGMNERAAWLLAGMLGFFALAFSMKSQLASVVERRRDIGILKAIGWADAHVVGQIFAESVLQAAIGGALGAIAAVGILFFAPVKVWSGIATPLSITVSPLLVLAILGLGLIGGGVVGAVSAWTAAQQRPADALRQG